MLVIGQRSTFEAGAAELFSRASGCETSFLTARRIMVLAPLVLMPSKKFSGNEL